LASKSADCEGVRHCCSVNNEMAADPLVTVATAATNGHVGR
jgi:hypothetical protein